MRPVFRRKYHKSKTEMQPHQEKLFAAYLSPQTCQESASARARADSRLASFDHQMRGPFFVLCAAFLFAAANAVAKALYMRGHTLVSVLIPRRSHAARMHQVDARLVCTIPLRSHAVERLPHRCTGRALTSPSRHHTWFHTLLSVFLSAAETTC